jgi:GT2 family glycosyltransferase
MCKVEKPYVSVITVNYKQTEVTLQLLESLEKCSYTNTEIIVVDNGSHEGLERHIHSSFPGIICITSEENLGFAGGNNLGILQAKGKYLLFLNNDTEVDSQFLEPLVKLMESDPTIGFVSPKIIYYGTDNTIQYAGSTGINPFTGRGQKIGSFEEDKGQFNKIYETSLGHGAAMMIPRSVIEEVGMIPDIFFLYYEEHDWCEAIKRAGYKVFYVGDSVVYHKESVSVGRMSTLKTFYMTRNRLLFLRRNNKGVALIVSFLFFALFTIPKNSLLYILKAQWDHLKAFYRGIGWNFTHYHILGFPMIPKI